jgi:hypothetical protein
MRNVEMQPWPMRLINNVSSVSMIGPFALDFYLKDIFSWSMTKIKIPWGQANSNPCGSNRSLLRKF